MTEGLVNYPVSLLRDERGIYGIGGETEHWQSTLLLRPDRLDGNTRPAALQMITGGFRRGPFRGTLEELFRQAIHAAMLRRAGFPWPPESDFVPWGSTDVAQQNRNRRLYHGTRLASLAVVNRLLREALAVTDKEALRQARRFPIQARNGIYHYAAKSHRSLQLVEAFPALALTLSRYQGNITETACELVERGVSLRHVAAVLGIPWAFKKVKPAAARFVWHCQNLDERLVHAYLPDSLADQKTWLQSVTHASHTSIEFASWVTQHSAEIGTREQTANAIMDLSDWVRASLSGDKFAARRFDPTMSLKTVQTLSHEWHEAVARDQDHSGAPFPPPWYAASEVGEFEFVPIESRADLYREGQAMHHCVASYANQVEANQVYVYSVRKDGERLATIALSRTPDGPSILQVRGPCNTEVPPGLMRTTRKWLRGLPPLPLPSTARRSALPSDVAGHGDPIAQAHCRGAEARASGVSRRALPPEYCTADRAREALAWIRGYDGEALPPQQPPLPSCDDAFGLAHRRGQEARASGLSRTMVPVEYRRPARTREALAWMAGYDGQPLLDEPVAPCPF